MNRLPTGVQLEIFILLHQSDRGECMRVCRTWESIINSFCLLHTISITSRHQVKKLKSMFKLEPQRCRFVERVVIFFNSGMNSDIGVLLSNLPALREICVPTAQLTKKQIRRGAFKYMEKYLEHLTEYSGSAMTTSLLEYNTYYRLKTLATYDNTYVSVRDLFSKLTNTPVLTELRIGKCSISTTDMELLHAAAPLLQSVYFTDANIIANDTRSSRAPSSIVIDYEPVPSLTTFSLKFHSETNRASDIVDFFRIVRKKYINLKKFELNYVDELRESRENEKRLLYKEVLQPYCQELGSSLKELSTFVVSGSQSLLGWLEETDCRIQNLNLEVSLTNWNLGIAGASRLKYIRKLTLKKLRCSEFAWLGDCTALKELNISFESSQNQESSLKIVKLDTIVNSIPSTVTALTLSCLQLQSDGSTIQIPSVKELELREVPLVLGLDASISQTFPQLDVLRLIQCGLPINEFITFDSRLSYLHVEDIRTKRNKPKAAMLLRTTDNNEERVYRQMKYRMGEDRLSHCLTKLDGTIYPQSKVVSYDSASPDSLIIITCRSVKNVIY
ncbi:hypothetical protein K501DRAFT_274038 [Backusella circina FSU 941]|nr:hypothetical protein K501DRAFT_274038 [Backusella circina FSU 941]